MAIGVRRVGGISAVVATGEIDHGNADTLRRALHTAPRQGGLVTLDASGVTFCDSSALRVLIDAAVRGGLRLHAPSSAVRRLLELTGTIGLFEIPD
jgi:anti-anti-sigma factor